MPVSFSLLFWQEPHSSEGAETKIVLSVIGSVYFVHNDCGVDINPALKADAPTGKLISWLNDVYVTNDVCIFCSFSNGCFN